MKTQNLNQSELSLDLVNAQNPQLVHPLVRLMRATGVVLLVLTYFIMATPFYPLLKIKPLWTKKHIIGPILQILGTTLLKIMGFKVTVSGDFDFKEGTVVASNHLNAYLDMMVLWNATKGSFLSTVEVQQMPLFGQIAELAGCIFIERRSRENLPEEIAKVKEQLDSGINLIFFPEGKCHDGTEVLRFKRPFFKPAIAKKADILTVTMNYHTVSGMPVTKNNKHQILWYRQQKIIKHLWNILLFKSVEVDVCGAVLKAEDYLDNTEEVAQKAQKLVEQRFNVIK